MKAGILVKLSHLDKGEQVAILMVVEVEVTHKITGAICAPTANTLPVVHIVVEAHWIDLIDDGDLIGEGNGD